MGFDIRNLIKKGTPSFAEDWMAGVLGSSTAYGLEQQLKAMQALGLVFAIVNKNANAVSQVQWHLFRKRDNRGRIAGPDTRRPVEEHMAWTVWEKPNKFTTRQEFVETQQQHTELTGEGWWWTDQPAGFPTTMWPLRPDHMEIVPAPLPVFIKEYRHRQPSGQQISMSTDEVVFLRVPDPMDSYRGLGPTKAAGIDIDNMRSSLVWNNRFFKNGMTAGGFVKFPNSMDEQEWKKQMKRLNEGRGMGNAHRIGILDNSDAEFIESKFTHKDMEFVSAINLSKEDILEAWGFPKFMLGVVTDVNRANAEASMMVYAQWTLIPRLERIKQALNNDFLHMFGEGTDQQFEFDYDSPVPDDLDAETSRLLQKVNAFATLRAQGVDPQQALEVCGLPKMDVGINQDVEEQQEVNDNVLAKWIDGWTKKDLVGANGNGAL